jgi:cytochrome c-type biogenesis protein CcmH
MINKFGFALLLLISCDLIAGVDVVDFSDESLRPRYQQLIVELRCPKCQNQNLADSNSPISVDLRNQVQRLLEEGKSNDEIKTYLSDRYSDFILYRPQVKQNTWALWIAPILLLLIGLLVFYRISQRQKAPTADSVAVSSQDKARLRELLKNSKGDSN